MKSKKMMAAAAAAGAAMAAFAPGALANDVSAEETVLVQEMTETDVPEDIPDAAEDYAEPLSGADYTEAVSMDVFAPSVSVSAVQETEDAPEVISEDIEEDAPEDEPEVSPAPDAPVQTEESEEDVQESVPVTLEDSIAVTETAASNAFTDPSVSEILVEKDCVDAKDLTELIGGNDISPAKNTLTIRTKDEIIDYYAENLLPYFSGDLDTPYGILYFDGYDYDAYGGIGGPVYYYNGEQFETYDLFDDGTITLSEGYRELCIKLINFYRWMAGLDPVVENKELSEEAQVGADYLDMLEHTYGKDYVWSINPHMAAGSDMSEEGRVADRALSGSNIAFGMGVSFTNAIVLWMQDEGSIDNILANGHRASLMDPFATSFGIGINYSTNICYALLCAGGHTDSPYYQQGYASALPVISITGLNSASDLASNELAVPTLTLNFGDASGTGDSLLKKTDDTELILVRDDGAVYIIPNLLTDNPVTDEEEKSAVFTSSRWWINPYGNLSLSLAGLGADEVYGHDFTVYLTNFYTGKINGGVQTVKFSFTADTLGLDPVTLSADASLVKEAVASLGDVTFSDMDDIEALQQAYANLSKKDQILLASDKSTLDDLQAQAETGRADYEAAKAVTDAVASLDAQSLTLEDADLVEALRAAYDALTDAQKVYAGDDSAIEALEERIASLKKEAEEYKADKTAADAWTDSLNALIDAGITKDSIDALDALDAAFSELTDTQKAMVAASDQLLLIQAKKDAQADKTDYDNTVKADAIREDMASAKTLDAMEEAQVRYNEADDAVKEKLADVYPDFKAAYDAAVKADLQEKSDQQAAEAFESRLADYLNGRVIDRSDAAALEALEDYYNAMTDGAKQKSDRSGLDAAIAAAAADQAAYDADLAAARDWQQNFAAWVKANGDSAGLDSLEAAYNQLTGSQKELAGDMTGEFAAWRAVLASRDREQAVKEAAASFRTELDRIGADPNRTIDEYKALLAVYNAADADTREAIDALCASDWAWLQDTMNRVIAEDIKAAQDAESFTEKLESVSVADGRDASAVYALREAYNALSDDAKAKLDESKLIFLEDALAGILQAEQSDVSRVQAMIDALGEPSLAMRAELDEIKAALEAMRPGLAASVSQNKYLELAAAVSELEVIDAANAQSASLMQAKIDALSVKDGADAGAVYAVRAAYDALDEDVKARVNTEGLEAAEAKLAEILRSEDALMQDIERRTEAAKAAGASKDAVEDLQALYDEILGLRDGLRGQADAAGVLALLTESKTLAAQDAADQAAADAFDARVQNTAVESSEDKDAVESLRAAYDALTDSQRAYADEDALRALEEALAAVTKAEEDEFAEIVQALSEIDENTDRETVETLKVRVFSILPKYREQLDLTQLNAADDRFKAQDAEDLIAALPDNFSSDAADAVQKAADAYDAVADKSLIDASLAEKIEALKAALADYNKQKAEDAAAVIDIAAASPSNTALTDAAKTAYESLTDAQRQYLSAKEKAFASPDTGVKVPSAAAPAAAAAALSAAAAAMSVLLKRRRRNA